jgi:hypothetical protein
VDYAVGSQAKVSFASTPGALHREEIEILIITAVRQYRDFKVTTFNRDSNNERRLIGRWHDSLGISRC